MERESSKECSVFFLWRKGSFSSRSRPLRNLILFSSWWSKWSVLKSNQGSNVFAEFSGTFCTLWPRKLRFEREFMYLWMFHRRVIHFSSAPKKIYKIRPDLRWILCWILPYVQPILLALTDLQSRECYANCFKGLTFRILSKNVQEMASLSIVLNFFIHKISSKHDRDTTASKLNLSLMHLKWHASLLRRCRQILYNCYFQVQFLDTFRYTANEFHSKISFTVYSRLLIWEF